MFKDVLLELLAPPVVALPPLVLLLTVALPEVDVWVLVFTTDRLLLLVIVALLLEVAFTTLLENGPVVLMLPLGSLAAQPPPMPASELLLTVTLALVLLELLAMPVEAPPALVLLVTTAEPVDALWSLVLVASTSLLLVWWNVLVLLAFTWLLELGPVSVIEPD